MSTYAEFLGNLGHWLENQPMSHYSMVDSLINRANGHTPCVVELVDNSLSSVYLIRFSMRDPFSRLII